MPRKNIENNEPEIQISPSGEAVIELNKPLQKEELESFEQEINEENLNESRLSKVRSFLQKKILPAAIEGSHDAISLFNKGVDYAAGAVSRVVPAVSEAVTGFVLPENIGHIVNKTVEYGTKGTTFVTKTLAKTALNVFTFGAPAWVDAFRQHLAVHEGNEKYEKVESSQDLLAINYTEHLKDERLKEALNEYYQTRKELVEARKNPKENAEKISELAEKIASYEMNYKDCVDFSNMKAILEKGKEFMDSNEALIKELAGETADKMIANVENFYKDKFGKLGDKVEGKWLGIITSPEKGREQLLKEITKRLKLVMSKELNKDATQMEMKRITGELFSEFGVYRKYLKAGIFTMLRCLPIPEGHGADESIWGQIYEKITSGFHAGKEVGETGAKTAFMGGDVSFLKALKQIAVGTFDKMKNIDQLKFLPSLDEYGKFFKGLFDQSVANFAGVDSYYAGEGVGHAIKWVTEGAEWATHHILEAAGVTAIITKLDDILDNIKKIIPKLPNLGDTEGVGGVIPGIRLPKKPGEGTPW